MVCAPCHRRAASSMPMRTTAELAVPVLPAELAAELAALAPAASQPGCSWCGKDAAAVKKLLGNGSVSICNECVGLCAEVMAAELGPDWR
jgi:hypothetical protein